MSSVEEDGVISVEGEPWAASTGSALCLTHYRRKPRPAYLKAAAVQAVAAEIVARAGKSLSATADHRTEAFTPRQD
jgi:hypothetical protein